MFRVSSAKTVHLNISITYNKHRKRKGEEKSEKREGKNEKSEERRKERKKWREKENEKAREKRKSLFVISAQLKYFSINWNDCLNKTGEILMPEYQQIISPTIWMLYSLKSTVSIQLGWVLQTFNIGWNECELKLKQMEKHFLALPKMKSQLYKSLVYPNYFPYTENYLNTHWFRPRSTFTI